MLSPSGARRNSSAEFTDGERVLTALRLFFVSLFGFSRDWARFPWCAREGSAALCASACGGFVHETAEGAIASSEPRSGLSFALSAVDADGTHADHTPFS